MALEAKTVEVKIIRKSLKTLINIKYVSKQVT